MSAHRSMGWMATAVGLSALTSCEIPPKYIDQPGVEQAIAKKKYKTACKGLEMKGDETRQFAAFKISTMVKDPIGHDCLCANLADEKTGWDRAIVAGLKQDEKPKDALVGCFADLVTGTNIPERLEATQLLRGFQTDSSRAAMVKLSNDNTVDPAVRSEAIKGISGKDNKPLLLTLLAGEKDAAVRAAAALRLSGLKDDDVVAALTKALHEDSDGVVRGTAMLSLGQSGVVDITTLACKAMMEDADPVVRRLAVASLHGARKDEAIACLKQRTMTEETDAEVRQALLDTLGSSPNDGAALILCEAIPFWLKTYVVTELPEKLPGTSIIEAQNRRDHARSYACVEKAYKSQSGYSCFAKLYVGWWYNEVGGPNARLPECPGYPAPPK
jgi:hypothetical protein